MKEPVRERINATLNENKLSVAAFSKEVGIGQTTLNRQLNGDARVSVDTIKAFLHRFKNVSAEWLLRGVGDECCGVPDEQLEREIAEETGRVQSIGDNSNHNTQTMTDSAIAKENEMLRKSIEEKNEEIKFLRSLIQRNTD
uniref:helix-turn-helix domain-containing protein n=1 Tax=Candidatus Limisoma sp. TaxID=3076476 RepID=UPI0040255135